MSIVETVRMSVLGALSLYITIGVAVGLAAVVSLLRDRDAVRVLRVDVGDVVLVFALGLWLWPMLLNDDNGPWRG